MWDRGLQIPHEWMVEEIELNNSSAIDVSDAEINFWQKGKIENTTKFVSRTAAYPNGYTRVYQAQVSNGAYDPSSTYYDMLFMENSWHRVIISSESVWTPSAVSNVEIQIPITWSGAQITFKIHQGALPSLVGNYVYIFDASGTTPINLIGMVLT